MHQYIRDHFVDAPSQWETTLQCNVVSRWLGTYTKWSLNTCTNSKHNIPYDLTSNTFARPSPIVLMGKWNGLGPISSDFDELMIQISQKYLWPFHGTNNGSIKSQFCTCHDSSAVMACANLWLDRAIKIKIIRKRIFARFQLWAYKPIAK